MEGFEMISRLKALRNRHGIIQSRIQREEMRPYPCSIRIMSMKRIRLQLREEIQKVEETLIRSTEKSPA
jgi:hypothetical protein